VGGGLRRSTPAQGLADNEDVVEPIVRARPQLSNNNIAQFANEIREGEKKAAEAAFP
jgi:hypothetical protein